MVVRVATSNNFNCTDKEWNQLDTYATNNPENSFFINANIRTPKLQTISKHSYKAVITANPDLIIPQSGINKILQKIETIRSQIAFVRVKYIPNNEPINYLLTSLIKASIPVVITLQRFNGKKSLVKFTSPEHYKFSCSRFRLIGPELDKILSTVATWQAANLPVWICDQSGKGCQGCGLCSKLTTGEDHKIASLNLSTSGICPYNCPDCYAKTMQHFCTSLGHKPIIYDTIRQNDKQAGRTAHIKESHKCSKQS